MCQAVHIHVLDILDIVYLLHFTIKLLKYHIPGRVL